MRSATSSRAGFTLMELMTVVVVVSVLAAMFLPLMDHFRQKSEVVVCTRRLRNELRDYHIPLMVCVTD